MNQRTTLVSIALLSLVACALPQASFAQSDPFIGTWQLNLAKSKFSPGPGPKAQTAKIEADGQSQKVSVTGVNAQGNPINNAFTTNFDGMPHPTSNPNPNFDASANARIDAHTLVFSRTKGGKLVGTQTVSVSSDGKMLTATTVLIGTNGQATNNIAVFDKQ
jgi:hypothetical protein